MNKDQITLKQLIRIADDVPWERFEAMLDGRLLLKDCAQTILSEEEEVNPLLWLFEMRVGLHFERPMQAIMSCGHFIRMRSAEHWRGYDLNKLDPHNPSGCLYWCASTVGPPRYTWPPISAPQALRQQNLNANLQNQVAGCYSTWSSNNTLSPQSNSVSLGSGGGGGGSRLFSLTSCRLI